MSKFIVFYTGFDHIGNHIHGHCTVDCDIFPSFRGVQNQLKESHDYMEKVTISNVIELTDKQFNAWISPPKTQSDKKQDNTSELL